MTPPNKHTSEGGRDDRGVPYHAEPTLSSAQVLKSGSRVPTDRSTIHADTVTLAPNPSTSPSPICRGARSRAAPRNLGRSRAISGDLGAAPRYLGRSRFSQRRAVPVAHLPKKRKGLVGNRARVLTPRTHPARARSSPSTSTPARTAHRCPLGGTLALAQSRETKAAFSSSKILPLQDTGFRLLAR